MGGKGLLVGTVATQAGVSRKALRLYEAAGIVPKPPRTTAGYRVYGDDVLPLLAFIAQARRLGFSLAEIREVVAIKRSGRVPCGHVRSLARRKLEELDRTLEDLVAVRERLLQVLRLPTSPRNPTAAVCPHIEQTRETTTRRKAKWKT